MGTTTEQQAIPAVVVTEEDDGSVIELSFGQSVILGDLGVSMDEVYIESDDTAIVYPVQPGEGRGTAGLVAVGEGAARVTVWETFPTGKAQVPTLVFEVLVAPGPDSAMVKQALRDPGAVEWQQFHRMLRLKDPPSQ